MKLVNEYCGFCSLSKWVLRGSIRLGFGYFKWVLLGVEDMLESEFGCSNMQIMCMVFLISLQSHQSFLIEAAGEYILFSGAAGERRRSPQLPFQSSALPPQVGGPILFLIHQLCNSLFILISYTFIYVGVQQYTKWLNL